MMKENCWKIRGLRDTPTVTISTVGKREARREKHIRQEVLVIQCAHCKLILHRGYLPERRLRCGSSGEGEPVLELERLRAKSTPEGVIMLCGKCRNKVATIGEGEKMKTIAQALRMIVPESPLPQLAPNRHSREPYDNLGAFSGLSYRKIMAQLYRLAYTKQSRYRLILREVGERLRGYENKFKGLYNLIILNENSKEKNSRTLPSISGPVSGTQKLEFDKMMRSTTVDHSNSRLHNSRLNLSRSRRRDSSLPLKH